MACRHGIQTKPWCRYRASSVSFATNAKPDKEYIHRCDVGALLQPSYRCKSLKSNYSLCASFASDTNADTGFHDI